MRNHIIAAIAVLTVGATQASALSADLAGDFSITNSNPNGAWTYGYTTSLGSTFNVHADINSNSTHQQWYSAGTSGDNTPSIFKNISSSSINGLDAGKVAMHSGPGGQYEVARYTASESGLVSIQGFFGVGDSGNVSTYVYVDGVAFVSNDATYDQVDFSFVTNLNAGSTVDFILGTGLGGYSFDTTPIDATIESVPEPTTMAIFGVAGLLAARRRRS